MSCNEDSARFPAPATSTTSLLLLSMATLVVLYRIKRRRLLQLAEKLPGPKGFPLIGNALHFLGRNQDVFNNIYNLAEKYSSVMKVWIGPKLMVFLFDPRDVELILNSTEHIDKSSEYKFFKPWLGEGLLISSGQKWQTHRKIMAPAFHQHVLKSFVPLFNTNSRAVVKRMMSEGDKPFNVHDYMSECTVDILLETAMGVDKKVQDQSTFDYAMAVMEMCNIIHLRHTKFWLNPDCLFKLSSYHKSQEKFLKVIHSLTKKVIQNKKAAIKEGLQPHIFPKNPVQFPNVTKTTVIRDDLDEQDENDVGQKRRLAFLDLMIENAHNGITLTDDEIKEEVDTIMFEGHDTTAAGSSFFLSLMGIHQDIQNKVVQELDEIFGHSDRDATFQDTMEMKYLERCILEALRLYPPVPVIAREIHHDVKLASGDYTIPAGCTVVIGTYKIHHRADIYPQPDMFNPDNFVPEKTQNRNYYAFIPFSAGPRSCVGRKYALLKLKILLSTILRNFRVYSDIKEEDFQLTGDIILKRAEGFNIYLKPREKNTV